MENRENINPLISILIVNYNGLKHLNDCFDSLNQQNFKDFEIVMVDNNSSDTSIAYTKKNFPNVIIVESDKNLGFAGGNNFGISLCHGKYIFCLNNDVIVAENCLSSLVKEIKVAEKILITSTHLTDSEIEETGIDLVISEADNTIWAAMMTQWGNPQLVDGGGDELYSWGLPFKYQGYNVSDSIFDKPREIFAACGGAVVYPKTLFEKLGGFDEQFFLIFEDIDLSLRAWHSGAKTIFVPKAVVQHKGSATIGGASKVGLYYSYRNSFWFKLKNYPLSTLLRHSWKYLIVFLLSFKGSVAQGMTKVWFKAHWDQFWGLSKIFKKRRKILLNSVRTSRELEEQFRPNWLKEKDGPYS